MIPSYLKFDYEDFNNNRIKEIISKFKDPKEAKILYISTYSPDYTRTETLLELFKNNNITFRAILTGNSKIKYLKAIYLLLKYQNNHDIIFVAFRGHEILPFIKIFSKKPIIFDAFVSIYDTLCFDRKLFKPNSLIGKLLKSYDKFLCKISNIILVDTNTHKEYFKQEFNADNIDYLYVGCDKNLFKPSKIKRNAKETIVFWYGYANPLQGVDIILKSAKLLEKENKKIIFRLIGPIKKKYSNLIKELNPNNIEFTNFIPYNQLPAEINQSDICLGGHFSNIDKAKRVIAGKTYQFIACNKPTIIGDNQANRELFDEKGIIHFVKINDENALAQKILEVRG